MAKILDISGDDEPKKKKKKVVPADKTKIKTLDEDLPPKDWSKKKKTVRREFPPAPERPKSAKLKLPKKVTGTELMAPSKRRISKLSSTGMRSILGDSVEEIQQMLEDNSNESAVTLIQKRALQTILDLIPYAEHNIRESKGSKGVYQINSLLTSLRELMIDIQSTRDKGQIGELMVEKVVRPTFLDVGMTLVQEDARMLKEIKDEVSVEAYKRIRQIHEDSLARTAHFIQNRYGEAKQQAISFMQQ